MTKRQGGASQPVMETFNILCAGTLAATITADPLITKPNVESFTTIVQASHDNGGRVLVGNAANQMFELDAGEAVSIPTSPHLIYVRAAAGNQVVNWLSGG